MDIEKIINGEPEKETQQPSSESQDSKETNQKDEESKRKEEQLSNLQKAIAQANEELRVLRLQKKSLKNSEEEELPKIDMNDPSAKAWDKHIRENVNPLQAELDNEKKEIRTFALQEFLNDKPALAKDAEKVKELVTLYEKIRTATERTKEGVLLDLNRAYAALHAEEFFATAQSQRIESAQSDAIQADIAVSRGGSSYQQARKSKPRFTEEEKRILYGWGVSEDEHAADMEKYGSK